MKHKRLLTILFAGLLVIMALAPIASVSAATQTLVSHCVQIDLGGGVFSTTCTPSIPPSGWNCVPGPTVVVSPTVSTFDVVCSREVADAAQPREAGITNISEVPEGSTVYNVEHWRGGETVLTQVMDEHTVFYFWVGENGEVEGGHFGFRRDSGDLIW